MRILYIDIDTQRADHLGCYGYHRNTSPNMDAIARDGVRFTRCYASDAPCLPSRAALYSGRFGINTGVVGHGGSAAQPKVDGKCRGFRDYFDLHGLPAQLQKAGFHTAMISPFGQRHSAHWFYAGFNEMHNTGKGGMESAEEMWPTADRWLRENAARDNWYLHLHFWDPHTPYRVPQEYGEPFANDPLPKWLDDDELIREHNRLAGPHTSLDVAMYTDQESEKYPRQPGKITDRASLRRLIDGYDTAIRYTDDHIGQAIAYLKQAGVYENTAIIISADHGENQGELGIYAEHATADHGTCHIPLIIKWPGGKQGTVAEGLQYNLDLAPTLMELLNQPAQSLWDGSSFAKAICNGGACGHDDLVISQCAHVCQRSVRWDRWLYIRTWHDGFHLFPQEMLFDVENDPHETRDLAPQHPEICSEGARRYLRWHSEQMAKIAQLTPHDVTDPMWTVVAEGGPFHAIHEKGRSPLPKYLERLEATGRSGNAAALRSEYAAHL